MVDTENKRRSVAGYTSTPILPVADATIGALDREMVAWLYSGIPAGAPPAPSLPYEGDAYIYDVALSTISIAGGLVVSPDIIYDETGRTVAIGGGTVVSPDTDYGQ